MYIDKNNGNYCCNECGKNGSWYDLKEEFGDIKSIIYIYRYNIDIESNINECYNNLKISNEEISKFQSQLFKDNKYKDVLKYLVDECKICCDTLEKCGIGACDGIFYKNNRKLNEKCVLFPYIDYNDYTIKNMRLLSIKDNKNEKYIMKNVTEVLFGWNECIYM